MRVSFARAIAALALVAGSAACGLDEPVSRRLGARCDQSTECDERCLSGSDYPGGFCSVTCSAQIDCGGGATCADDQGGVCLFACKGDPDCAFLGTGWACKSLGGLPSGQVMVCRGG